MTRNFDRYTVYIYHGTSYEALIQLFNGSNFVGNLIFHPESALVPASGITSSQSLNINFQAARLPLILQVLQTEKPLYASVVPASGIGHIGTSATEPVGEQEGV